MNTEQQAQQLRLAANIIQTGHPWEYRIRKNDEWRQTNASLAHVFTYQGEIRLALATPPDGSPLHNPDNLDAEQVGAGWRLCVLPELDGRHKGKTQLWVNGTWDLAGLAVVSGLTNSGVTYRVPLSTPWPERVPLGPEDVPPGCALRSTAASRTWASLAGTADDGIIDRHGRTIQWGELFDYFQINRSLPLTGKWNPDAWEPCSKSIDP